MKRPDVVFRDKGDSVWRQRVMRGRTWASYLPLAVVIAALVALVALPVLAERRVRPLNRELRDVVEPARALVTRIHVELAIQGSTFHDYLDTRDSALLQRYGQAYAREVEAQRDLGRYVGRLGQRAQQRFHEVQALGERWHRMVEQILRNPGSSSELRRAAMTEENLFEELLLATAELDDALGLAARDRRLRVNDAERTQRRFTTVVGLVALAAVGGVAWLAQRVRVFARTAEERRVQLERATESRARLMRGVSHDLKNPLGAIDGHASLLEDGIKGPLNPDQRESVARIRRSVRALLGLITDLLELSKAESGRLTVKPRPTNIAEIVRETADEHRDAAAAAGHELRTEIGDGVPTIETDPDRLRQVLGNLLSNAVKYTPRGGHILVRVEERPGDGHVQAARSAAIDVVDSGPGIPHDKLDEIFEEFSRLETDATPGTGLGLTIARRISRLLGGEISAASEVGRGATFTLWLPIEHRVSERGTVERRRL
jgi:signal transduction histidine kinase